MGLTERQLELWQISKAMALADNCQMREFINGPINLDNISAIDIVSIGDKNHIIPAEPNMAPLFLLRASILKSRLNEHQHTKIYRGEVRILSDGDEWVTVRGYPGDDMKAGQPYREWKLERVAVSRPIFGVIELTRIDQCAILGVIKSYCVGIA